MRRHLRVASSHQNGQLVEFHRSLRLWTSRPSAKGQIPLFYYDQLSRRRQTTASACIACAPRGKRRGCFATMRNGATGLLY